MKRTALALSILALCTGAVLGTAQAQNAPVSGKFISSQPAPVVVQPQPVLVQPAPVLVQPAPVIMQPPVVNQAPYGNPDRNGDQHISRREAREHPFLKRNFKEIDTNRDGFLSRDELRVFHSKNRLDTNGDHVISRFEARGHPFLESHFHEIDTNRDGLLSPQERRAYKGWGPGMGYGSRGSVDQNNDHHISRDEARGHPFLQRNFREIDTNRDRYLSREEMRAFHSKNRLDTNGDHMISRYEAIGHPVLEARFNEIDTNRDGALSPQERQAYFNQRRPGPPPHMR
jgi:Ca2+-binding EF-hand superfamily protein